MIVNVWKPAPADAAPLLSLARAHGWRNLPVAERDVRVAWRRSETNAPGAVSVERHLPSRQYSAVAPSFDALMDALAWEAHEWIAVEAWRARRKVAHAASTSSAEAA